MFTRVVLACAVRADDGMGGVFSHREGHVAQCDESAEAFCLVPIWKVPASQLQVRRGSIDAGFLGDLVLDAIAAVFNSQ